MNARLSGGLARVILKALEKHPEQRYGSARELGADLDRLSIGVAPLAERRHWRAVTLMVAAALLAAAVVGGLVWRTQAHKLTEKDTVVLADFANSTGEPIFDGTLKKALAVDLGQSPYMNVFPEQRVRQALQYMGKAPEERITPDVAREICQREGLKAMITGSIASLGSQYVITLDATNAASGDTLAETQGQAARKEQVLDALSNATASLRTKLGESLSSVQKYDVPLSQATTASLEALKALSLGDAKHFAGEDLEALPLYRRAVEQDPQFALAYARLAAVYGNTNQMALSLQSGAKAFELRNHASERERLYIAGHYHADRGEIDKGIEAYELYKQSYPRDSIPYNNLSIIYFSLGEFDKAFDNAQHAYQLDSNSAANQENLAQGLMALQRMDEAKALLTSAAAKKFGGFAPHAHLAQIYLAQGDLAAMRREEDLMRARPQGPLFTAGLEAKLAFRSGQLRRAHERVQDLLELSDRLGLKELHADLPAFVGVFDAFYGYPEGARKGASLALKESREPDVLVDAATGLAVAGEGSRALELAQEAAAARPNDLLLTRVKVPVVKAWVLIKRGDGAGAVQIMEPAKPYDGGNSGALLTRGWAYELSGQPRQAVQEFERALRMRYFMPEDPNLVVTQLGLARAYASMGDMSNARKQYAALFQNWKDADAGVPMIQKARAEQDKLK